MIRDLNVNTRECLSHWFCTTVIEDFKHKLYLLRRWQWRLSSARSRIYCLETPPGEFQDASFCIEMDDELKRSMMA
ncbi:hypothetical protein Pmani_035027 [Petrolisthes manimaculis]|uniref:Uncharacterized protein n=1 Tax=Petrolisthes manimaculis TaxID=1843537 RepID=A0AAE1NLG1_9EUCA|nr:hypothetical protein Pmani_035027 [Petrolisthes manimaculis]